MKKDYFILVLFIIGILTLNYSFLDSKLTSAFDFYEIGNITRVIDGDTVVINGTSVRLLGINSPEKGEIGYDEAKEFLEKNILGKEVRLEFGASKFDRYKRKLAYIFLKNKNINLASVENGFSSFYFPEGKTKYYSQFVEAWANCMEDDIGICKKSSENCIKIYDWNIKNQEIVFENICSHEIDLTGWSVKDEGRKKIVFSNKKLNGFEKITLNEKDFNKDYVWTKTGDSVFIRDGKNLLVIWDNY